MPRQHTHEEIFPVSAERLFALLHTPSAIRGWWGAARAIVVPEEGGLWAAAWGEDEDAPDYITVATLKVFDPPRRMTLGDYRYVSKDGPLPFEADFVTTFEVEAVERASARLRVIQDGFPDGAEADDFYAACETGWRDTFAGIRRFLDG
jgi:uncharacterized protein YndB with AHSA1/START domain